MADNNKLFADFQSVFTKYVLPIGVSTATVGIFFFLRKFGILYQLFHKVYILHLQVQHCFLKTKLPKSMQFCFCSNLHLLHLCFTRCLSLLAIKREGCDQKRKLECAVKRCAPSLIPTLKFFDPPASPSLPLGLDPCNRMKILFNMFSIFYL